MPNTKSKKAPKSKKTAKAKSAPKRENDCLCGCGEKVQWNFKQGHDASLRGKLLRGEIKNPTAEQKGFAKAHGIKIGSQKKTK
jgi:hypothetical protein